MSSSDSPVPSLRSICVALIPKYFRFSKTELKYVSKAVLPPPPPSPSTISHSKALKATLNTGEKNYGLFVAQHEIYDEVDTFEESKHGFLPAVKTFKTRTTYSLVPPSLNKQVNTLESFMTSPADLKVDINWAHVPDTANSDSYYLCMALDYKGTSISFINEDSVDYVTQREKFVEVLSIFVADLKEAYGVPRLRDLLTREDVEAHHTTLHDISQIMFGRPAEVETDGDAKLELLILLEIFLGENADALLSRDAEFTSNDRERFKWISELMFWVDHDWEDP